ncbi:MAG: hypothetical protein U0931_11760 [Vulcanimicrobiota bacterium]
MVLNSRFPTDVAGLMNRLARAPIAVNDLSLDQKQELMADRDSAYEANQAWFAERLYPGLSDPPSVDSPESAPEPEAPAPELETTAESAAPPESAAPAEVAAESEVSLGQAKSDFKPQAQFLDNGWLLDCRGSGAAFQAGPGFESRAGYRG